MNSTRAWREKASQKSQIRSQELHILHTKIYREQLVFWSKDVKPEISTQHHTNRVGHDTSDNKMKTFDKICSEINELVRQGKAKHPSNENIFARCCEWENRFTTSNVVPKTQDSDVGVGVGVGVRVGVGVAAQKGDACQENNVSEADVDDVVNTVAAWAKEVDTGLSTSDSLNSSYLLREVDVYAGVTDDERILSEYIFFCLGDIWEDVYKTTHTENFKVLFESFALGLYIRANAMDAFTELMNYEEKTKSAASPFRFFASTDLLSSNYYSESKGTTERLEKFKANIERYMARTGILSLVEVDIVFVPIIRSDHFVLLAFNLQTGVIDLLDNSANAEFNADAKFKSLSDKSAAMRMKFEERYGPNPEILRNVLSMYLESINHPIAQQILVSPINRLKMRWRTTNNGADCGVFAMRHMETYYGKKHWRCNLATEGPEQDSRLRRLRFKYLSKILLSDTNQLRDTVAKKARVFHENGEPRLAEEVLILELKKRQEEI